jgi:hypothetical protein
MRKVTMSLLAAAAALASVPASAQVWRLLPSVRNEIQSDINQLRNQIQRAQQRRTISPREATGLRRQALTVQRNYNRYARNGLSLGEVRALEAQVNTVRRRLRLERRDWDRRRG